MPYFETTDGTRLAYEDYGTGRPVIFNASWTLNADMWERQIPYFAARGYRCIALDRRGHGRSERSSTGYDLDTTADDLAALIEHLDLRDAVLVGHSMGGAEAAHYLARHGEDRVSRVAFVSATLPFVMRTEDNPAGVPEEILAAGLDDLRRDRLNWFTRQSQLFFATQLGNVVSPAAIDATIQQSLTASPWASVQLMDALCRTDFRDGLRRITIPALIIHGVADFSANIDLTARRTAELIPGNVYKEYPTAGHGLFMTHADELNEDLLKFIDA
ncbi:non-heme chloroperoxidase [Kitasatospora sp. MAA4]|uniref:alpha/beta fold hydrolase n=1 Tax=Kitasatospora sp. MAA4 TaxID=3035093 RepID=UPI0024739C7E|nr:alpha/beta hydrolase [Kitasatospora sp. MAA4]MDH6137417.1 non-heme chloroperoxidase [Kitasatospora sp. MAA4]